MNENPFNITREELLELAAQKLADNFDSSDDIHSAAYKLITKRVEEAFATGIKQRIDQFLADEMARIIATEICPVNIWGEREGKPVTLRATLAAQAKTFWESRVDGDGRPTDSWSGTPRSKQLMAQIMKDEFAAAVKSNAEVIVAEFKAALRADAVKIVTDNIDKLITVGGGAK